MYNMAINSKIQRKPIFDNPNFLSQVRPYLVNIFRLDHPRESGHVEVKAQKKVAGEAFIHQPHEW